MAEAKPHLNLAFIGHVDHGKSTTVGRLMFETGAVDAHVIDEYRKEAASKGKATFEFACHGQLEGRARREASH
jgi:elongation factor 1-alpha